MKRYNTSGRTLNTQLLQNYEMRKNNDKGEEHSPDSIVWILDTEYLDTSPNDKLMSMPRIKSTQAQLCSIKSTVTERKRMELFSV